MCLQTGHSPLLSSLQDIHQPVLTASLPRGSIIHYPLCLHTQQLCKLDYPAQAYMVVGKDIFSDAANREPLCSYAKYLGGFRSYND